MRDSTKAGLLFTAGAFGAWLLLGASFLIWPLEPRDTTTLEKGQHRMPCPEAGEG